MSEQRTSPVAELGAAMAPPDARAVSAAMEAHAPFAVTDDQGRITWVSAELCRLSGYDRDELLGQTHALLKSGVHDQTFYRRMWATLVAGKVWRGEVCNRRKSGELYWTKTLIVPVVGRGAGPTRYVALREDISERVDRETRLAQRVAELESMFEVSMDLLVLAAPDGSFVKLNAAWEETLGWPLDVLEATPPPDLVHPDDLAPTREAVVGVLQGRPVRDFVNRCRASDGTFRYLEWRSVLAEDGLLVAAARDVTERERLSRRLADSNQQLVESEKMLRSLFNVAPVGLVLHRFYDGRFLRANPTLFELVPFSEAEIAESSIWDLALWPDLASARDILKQLTFEAAAGPLELEIPQGDGRTRSLKIKGVLMTDASGDQNILSVVQDVSAEHDHARELLASRLAAEQATVAKSHFLANMSHEIRTPMTGIIGMLDILLESSLEETQRERATVARSSAVGLLQILNDILDFSRLEAHELKVERVPYDPRQISEDVTALLRPRAEGKSIALALRLDPMLPTWVLGDPTRFRQVLVNLVGNAIKFTSAGGVEIGVRSMRTGGEPGMYVTVQDTGIGMSEEAQRHLFERFYQADASTTRKFGGTGLGLAISKQLVGLMGGKLGVDSKLGVGSTFWFQIPALPADPPRTSTADLMPGPPGASRLRILAAEDNQVNQMILRHLLEQIHDLTIVDDGRAAVEAIERDAFDLVLMDVQMPVMGGIEATRAIRRLSGPAAQTPIVALTANTLAGDRERYLEAGMDDYLDKPYKKTDLLRIVERVAAAARQGRARERCGASADHRGP